MGLGEAFEGLKRRLVGDDDGGDEEWEAMATSLAGS